MLEAKLDLQTPHHFRGILAKTTPTTTNVTADIRIPRQRMPNRKWAYFHDCHHVGFHGSFFSVTHISEFHRIAQLQKWWVVCWNLVSASQYTAISGLGQHLGFLFLVPFIFVGIGFLKCLTPKLAAHRQPLEFYYCHVWSEGQVISYNISDTTD